MKNIKLLIMDVDGTLTDGGVYISDSGELMKKFYIKDGYAIKHMLPNAGILPAIITGRKSDIVSRRCEELDIEYVIQGCDDKVKALNEVLDKTGVTVDQIAYIGDDLNDVGIMKLSSIVGCPSDAVKDVLAIADFISPHKGGEGAVRDFIEWLISDEE